MGTKGFILVVNMKFDLGEVVGLSCVRALHAVSSLNLKVG